MPKAILMGTSSYDEMNGYLDAAIDLYDAIDAVTEIDLDPLGMTTQYKIKELYNDAKRDQNVPDWF